MRIVLVLLALLALGGIILRVRGQRPDSAHFSRVRTQSLKGLLALSIVVGHLSGYCLIPMGWEWTRHFLFFGDFAVPVFFFLCGYGLLVSYRQKGDSYLTDFLSHRVLRILLPLVVATVCLPLLRFTAECLVPPLCPPSLADGMRTAWATSLSQIFQGTTLLPFSWFVFTLLLYYLFFWLIARCCRSLPRLLLTLLGLNLAYMLFMHSKFAEDCGAAA